VKPTFRPELFVPLVLGGERIGWLRPELAARLGAWKEVFRANAERVTLMQPDALDPVVEQLAKEGFITGWRNERYRIADRFEVERAAALPFGFPTRAVHLNGIAGGRMWLARRSTTKQTDPGMLDNLVAGGISVGYSVEATLVKEAWEEAGLPAELSQKAQFGGTLTVVREVPRGVQWETVIIYDLELPADFRPANQDGEVSEFKLLAFSEVERQIADGALTHEAALAAQDYLKRRRARAP
jgi:8-oxo-dGTP pyrophosphatase MutT (NUDIX family)